MADVAAGGAAVAAASATATTTTDAPSLEMVLTAIRTLFHNPDPKEKERADTWLKELQKSVHAWKVG